MKYNLVKEEIVYDGFLKIKKGVVQHESFHKELPIEIEREFISKQDAVGIVIYEKDSRSILMVNQFRYPTTSHGLGWLLEIPAGMMEENEDAKTCAKREVKEELGYNITNLKEIYSFYTSPGCLSEKINLFFAEVESADQTQKGGGLEEEKEDILMVKLPAEKILESINNGNIRDAKSIIGLQWFLSNK